MKCAAVSNIQFPSADQGVVGATKTPCALCAPPARCRSPKNVTWEQTALHARATSGARAKKKKVHMKDTHSDKINSESLIRWSEERPATRASLAPSGKIHKTISTISNRALHLIKIIARDAVNRESPDGPDSV